MLPLSLIEKMARDLKIAPLNIIREHLEMETLYYLSQSKLSENLIFYGGTALRLAYNSFRFSEDLDFLFIKKLKDSKKELSQALKLVAANNPGVKVEEIFDKRQTLFGLLHIKHELLKHPIRIKIEICKKKNGVETENTLLISPTSNKEIIFPTATSESIFKAKKEANFITFGIVTLIGLAINSGIVYAITTFVPPTFVDSQKLWANLAKVLATGISLIWNFTGYRLIVFKK